MGHFSTLASMKNARLVKIGALIRYVCYDIATECVWYTLCKCSHADCT